ncbi:MAG: amidohydrolase [Ignavibacteria bacterium]|nr:amidohydrolase [Ignavibacteria bacterium]
MIRQIVTTASVSLLVLSLVIAAGGCQGKRADLVLHNGNIITMDEKRPAAQAVAIQGDLIVAVGTDTEIQPYIGQATRTINLNGATVTPGLIDAHGHFMSIGQAKMRLELMKSKNWDEIVAMVAAAAKKAKPGEWILGRGWHQEKWDKKPRPSVEGFPTHASLSRVSPDNPVMLTHASGHASIVNAKCLELSSINRGTPNPVGGDILKDAQGNPTGLLRETAQRLAQEAFAQARSKISTEERETERHKQAELAAEECLSKGVTTFHDAGVSFETIDLYKKLVDEGKLGVRLWVMVSEENDSLRQRLAQYHINNYGDRRLTVRSIKRLADGALGARGAWLLEPYSDMPTSTGLNTTPMEKITETAKIALQHGFQLCVHAIGDRGNREVLNVYESVFKDHPEKSDLRWRIEHAQHIHPDDIQRFGQLGVIASMQGIHCTSDAPYVLARLGVKRAEEGAYVWQKLMKTGAVVANGTDAPVEDVDPIVCFYASVSRKLKDGSVFYPDQRMSRYEALKSYTINAAYAGFEEEIKGSLAVGKLADLTVLSKDILTIPEDEIPSTEVLYTIVGGKVMYERK